MTLHDVDFINLQCLAHFISKYLCNLLRILKGRYPHILKQTGLVFQVKNQIRDSHASNSLQFVHQVAKVLEIKVSHLSDNNLLDHYTDKHHFLLLHRVLGSKGKGLSQNILFFDVFFFKKFDDMLDFFGESFECFFSAVSEDFDFDRQVGNIGLD